MSPPPPPGGQRQPRVVLRHPHILRGVGSPSSCRARPLVLPSLPGGWRGLCGISRGSQEDREGGGTGEESSRDEEMRRSTFWKGWRSEPPLRPRFLSGGHPGPRSQFSKQPATDLDSGQLETSWVRMQSPRGKREFGVGEVCLPPSCEVQRGPAVREGADGTPVPDTCRCPQEAAGSVRPGLGLRMWSVGQNHAPGLFASSGTRNGNSLQKTKLLGGQGGWVSGPDAAWGGRLQPPRWSSPSGRIEVQLEAWEELGISSRYHQPRPPWWGEARGRSPRRDPAGVEGLVLLGPKGWVRADRTTCPILEILLSVSQMVV